MRFRLVAIVLAWLCVPALVRADYTMASGDSVRLTFLGVPNGSAVSLIGSDGMARFPLIGEIQAAGLTLNEFQQDTQFAAQTRKYLYRNEQGELTSINLREFEAFAEIVQYRPVSVVGRVTTPGVIGYEPGMTVLSALARAGGTSVLPGVLDPAARTFLDDLIQQQVLAYRIVSLRAQIWRHEALLAEDAEVPVPEFSGPPVDAQAIAPILEGERATLRAELELRELRRTALRAERASTEAALGLVQRQLEITRELVNDSQVSLERFEELANRGLTQADRVESRRRALALSNSQFVELLRLEQDFRARIEELQSDLASLDKRARSELLKAKTALQTELSEATVRLQGLRRILLLAPGPVLSAGELPRAQVEITIARGGDVTNITDLNANVMPGDVITVRLLDWGL